MLCLWSCGDYVDWGAKICMMFKDLNRLCIYIVTIALLALFGVYVMQILFHIMPCELCLWQRYPYYMALTGAVLVPLRYTVLALKLQCFGFFANVLVAGYHSGLERGLWQGITACSHKGNLAQTPQDILLQLQSTPLVPCDVMGWQFLGLSLTNYNLILSCILFLVIAYHLRFR